MHIPSSGIFMDFSKHMENCHLCASCKHDSCFLRYCTTCNSCYRRYHRIPYPGYQIYGIITQLQNMICNPRIALETTSFFNSWGFTDMLLLILFFASMPRAVNTAKAVGEYDQVYFLNDQYIIRHGKLNSNHFSKFKCSLSIGPFQCPLVSYIPPGLMPNEMAGNCGFIFDPASTINIGIRDLANAAA